MRVHAKRLTLAVDFGEHTNRLVELGAMLCEQLEAELHLVHVQEPWDQYGLAKLLGHDNRVMRLVQTADADTSYRVQNLLAQLADSVSPQIPVSTSILQGPAPEAIITAAITAGSAAILVGTRADLAPFTPKNLSTALALMNDSPLPVMVVPENAEFPVPGETWRFLVCDDLSPDTAEAMQHSLLFARAFRAAEFIHLHVTKLSPQALDQAIANVMDHNQPITEPGLTGENVYQLAEEVLQQRLATRFRPELLEHTAYRPVLKQGEVHETVNEMVRHEAVHILCFGRHEIFHQEPFYVGVMPYSAMIDKQRPVMIFPKEYKLQGQLDTASLAPSAAVGRMPDRNSATG